MSFKLCPYKLQNEAYTTELIPYTLNNIVLDVMFMKNIFHK